MRIRQIFPCRGRRLRRRDVAERGHSAGAAARLLGRADRGRAEAVRANCGRCHNTDGAGVPGIELFKQIRRATTDDDIAKLIQNGIPGTSMPQHRFSNPQALVGRRRSCARWSA